MTNKKKFELKLNQPNWKHLFTQALIRVDGEVDIKDVYKIKMTEKEMVVYYNKKDKKDEVDENEQVKKTFSKTD